ncbi:MAG: JAB domain-containing protein [Planctomycetes bacterium]|nr:JAB domain-containing protein [Planctomycetota bacterium]MCB9910491.1 JAB domain-containing protein [Planctomycetota bacterium]MCB9912617.1 JAB domain-containing protein [Planctomycetota bacterium]
MAATKKAKSVPDPLESLAWIRVKAVREACPESLQGFGRVNCPDQIRRAAEILIGDEPREVFLVFLLDTSNGLQGYHIVSQGTLNSSLVHPREVFQPAILANAASIIVVHNHPSGDPTPSQADRDVTKRLVQAGNLLGIPLLDHLVVTHTGAHRSMRDCVSWSGM